MVGFGSAMLGGGLLTAVVSLFAYVAYHRGRHEARDLGRAAFNISALAVGAASLMLLLAFLQGRYDIAYVSEYSSRSLPLLYRVSAFWAGQEGSFLLWALMAAVMGVVLSRKTGDWEGAVMAFFSAAQAFVLLLLVVKSPFQTLPTTPDDGQGLNPLLQDPWMAIHPPAIFLGYAALAVPFAFALAALLKRSYDGWVGRALPWTLFAWAALGAGIFIGGYWAYRVLGWGGYWGWDPVENASLVPWLLSTALLHGMIMQQTRGSLKIGNLLLALGSFVMVLYGTFLTRSGVLKDFSVHSFPEPARALYWTLLVGMVLSAVGPVVWLATRAGRIKSTPTYDTLLSRDFAFFIGILVLCISAAIVTIGTSAPIVTPLFGKPAPVKPEFYNRTHFPVAVLLALLLGLTPILAWKQNVASVVSRALRPQLGVALIGAVVAFALGVRSPLMLLLVAASVLALAANVVVLARHAAGGRLQHTGGPLSHVGLALMLIGIVGSSVYSRSQKVTLRTGASAQALGYRVSFHEVVRPDENRRDVKLTLEKGGARFEAVPRMVFSPQMNSWVHSPAVRKYWHQDIYVSPVSLQEGPAAEGTQGELNKGETMKAGPYSLTFERFDTAGHETGGGMTVGAVVSVKGPDGRTATITPAIQAGGPGEMKPIPATIPGTKVSVALVGIAVPRIRLVVSGLPAAAPANAAEEVTVEVSSKPLINVLWLGSVLVLLGGLVGVVRRARESVRAARQEAEADAEVAANNGRRRERTRGGVPTGSR